VINPDALMGEAVKALEEAAHQLGKADRDLTAEEIQRVEDLINRIQKVIQLKKSL
jgi:hypothetical protein